MTWHQSRWFLSIVVPFQPHFRDQLPDTYTLWGYALFSDITGDYVDKTIEQATRAEVLDELLGHPRWPTTSTPGCARPPPHHVEMPYIDSCCSSAASPATGHQSSRRGRTGNFAFVGQFVEIPGHHLHRRVLQHAAYRRVHARRGHRQGNPPLYRAMQHPDVAWRATRTLLSNEARGEDPPRQPRMMVHGSSSTPKPTVIIAQGW